MSALSKRPQTPSELSTPAYLMNLPFSFTADIANNKWMQELPLNERRVNFEKAYAQWLDLYGELTSEGIVYILPTKPQEKGEHLQDLVFVGNLGIVLSHKKSTVIISRFKSEPRRGESLEGINFFASMGYSLHYPEYYWEGEAELKHLYDNVYIGGYGQRSDKKTYEWMEEQFQMKVIKVEMVDEYFYHLDCTIFPITPTDTLVCTKMFTKSELTEIERETNIIDATVDDCFQGLTNSVRVGNTILCASNINELKKNSADYKLERTKNRNLEDLAAELALEVKLINLSEFLKGGAVLSCMVMHLNRNSYRYALL